MLPGGSALVFRVVCHRCYGSSANQMATVLKKLTGGRKGSGKWYDNKKEPTLVLPSAKPAEKGVQSKQQRRRASMLNKLFMRNITDLMATGRMSEQLLGYGIQVSKVQITPDFNMVNVFWLAQGSQQDEEIEKVLKRTAGMLKHELSQLRVMGIVPYVTFVKDSRQARVSEVERILASMDFGEDYEPSVPAERLREALEVKASLSPEIVEKIQKLEATEEVPEEALPEMRNDVFGLDQSHIMGRITRDIGKTRAAWEVYERRVPGRTEEQEAAKKVDERESEEIQDRFKRYLAQRQFDRKPRRKSWKRVTFEEEQFEDEEAHFYDGDYLDEEVEEPRNKEP